MLHFLSGADIIFNIGYDDEWSEILKYIIVITSSLQKDQVGTEVMVIRKYAVGMTEGSEGSGQLAIEILPKLFLLIGGVKPGKEEKKNIMIITIIFTI